jgi:hypothetical protein
MHIRRGERNVARDGVLYRHRSDDSMSLHNVRDLVEKRWRDTSELEIDKADLFVSLLTGPEIEEDDSSLSQYYRIPRP